MFVTNLLTSLENITPVVSVYHWFTDTSLVYIYQIVYIVIHRLVETYRHFEKVHQFRTWKTRSSNSIVPWRWSSRDAAVISGTDGVDKITERLNWLYKKDELTEKYNALESFKTYKRNSGTSICGFLTEFEKRYHKAKSHDTIWSDDLLVCCLLKLANLTIRDEQLVKATISELKYDIVKTKLIKIFWHFRCTHIWTH